MSAIQAEIWAEQAKLKDRVLQPLASQGVTVVRAYDNMPMVAVRVENLSALTMLLHDNDVVGLSLVTLPEGER